MPGGGADAAPIPTAAYTWGLTPIFKQGALMANMVVSEQKPDLLKRQHIIWLARRKRPYNLVNDKEYRKLWLFTARTHHLRV